MTYVYTTKTQIQVDLNRIIQYQINHLKRPYPSLISATVLMNRIDIILTGDWTLLDMNEHAYNLRWSFLFYLLTFEQ